MHAECLVDILIFMARWRFRKIHTETYRNLSESYDKVPKNTGISKKTQTQIIHTYSQCLKITEKVSFNIASEASYVYILSVMVHFGEFLKT